MPVISLPEYLGISEAPQQPVFQRTRQVEPDSPWARTMQVADSLTALRNQRPMAQIQAIQNEYDMIRENAEKLRREREAAMQAEQAVSSLAGLTPDSPDYLNQRRQIMTQFPSAILDPRVQSIMDDSDRMYNARQQAEARRQEEITTRAAELAGVGIDANEAMRLAQQGAIAASGAKYQATRKPEQDQSIGLRTKELEMLERQQKAMDERMVDVEDPEYVQLDNDIKQLRSELRQAYRSGYAPEPKVATSRATNVSPYRPGITPTAPAATPEPTGSFKEKMKGVKPPSASEILKVDDKEIIKDLDDPSADENTFNAAITDPNTSLDVKKKALEKLNSFIAKPKFPAGTTLLQAKAKIDNLKKMAEEGQKMVRMQPELEKYRKAWTEEKNTISKYIKEFAESLGLDAELLENSLAVDEVTLPDPENPITIRQEFEQFLKEKQGGKKPFLSRQADKLLPFSGSEFAKELGTEGYIPGFRSFGKGKTYGDVLDAYLAEKSGSGLPTPSGNANVANPSGIKSIKPLP
jgi:hypothetical protein